MNKILGMKVYDNDWFLKFRFSYSEVAKILKDWGVNLILTQSKYIPMPDTAVKSEISKQEKKLIWAGKADLKTWIKDAKEYEGIRRNAKEVYIGVRLDKREKRWDKREQKVRGI